ncbi:MAG: glycosyltransferase, partial [Gammaproteobacteria bacterium]|nr:glycosyltransferase [Gammaproteobacteria bacterium]
AQPDGQAQQDCVEIVWNHRREYDKGPDLLLATVNQLISRGVRFRLHLLGQRFRQQPEEFDQLEQLLQTYYQRHNITPGINGYISDRLSYLKVLQHADIVLSTARHDFQGLSMLEATALGCFPVAPDALAYPEYFEAGSLYPVDAPDVTIQACAAADLIVKHSLQRDAHRSGAPAQAIARLSASNLTASWQKTLLSLMKS